MKQCPDMNVRWRGQKRLVQKEIPKFATPLRSRDLSQSRKKATRVLEKGLEITEGLWCVRGSGEGREGQRLDYWDGEGGRDKWKH